MSHVKLPTGWKIIERAPDKLPCGCGCACGADERDRYSRRYLRRPGRDDMMLIGNKNQRDEDEMLRVIIGANG